MAQPFNANGFGIGFHTEGEDKPCIVRTCAPAWSNRSMESIAQRIPSSRVFAPIRAASSGLPVQDTNCHPYGQGRFQLMHNGDLANFRRFKRRHQNRLSDGAWESIEGSTDSEHASPCSLTRLAGSRPT